MSKHHLTAAAALTISAFTCLTVEARAQTTFKMYTMSNMDVSYSSPYVLSGLNEWGHHALRWKSYRAGRTLDAAAANAQAPQGTVACTGAATLNQLEAAASVFPSDPFTDPAGSWFCFDVDQSVAPVLIALEMFFWKTPAYVTLRDLSTTVINGIEFGAPGASSLEAVCGWNASNPPSDYVQTATQCAQSLAQNGVFLSKVMYSRWVYQDSPTCGGPPSIVFLTNQQMGAGEFLYFASGLRSYVVDPPSADPQQARAIVEIARALSRTVSMPPARKATPPPAPLPALPVCDV